MLEFKEIQELIKQINESNIEKLQLKHGHMELSIKKASHGMISTPVIANTNAETMKPTFEKKESEIEQVILPAKNDVDFQVKEPKKAENLYEIKSPMVGTFYKATNPESKPFVEVGQKVNNDTIVCMVEAMKLFNEIEAEINGEIVEVLVENGQLVEFGQPMFLVRPL